MEKAQLSSDEAFDLADSFDRAANCVSEYRMQHRNELSDAEKDRLFHDARTMRTLADRYRAVAVSVEGADAAEAVQKLKDATGGMCDALQRVATAKKAVELTTAIVGLAGAVATSNPGAILSAARGVIKLAKA